MVKMKILLKAAIAFKNSGLGTPIIVAKENIVKQRLKEIGYGENLDIKIVNSTDKKMRDKYVKFLFKKCIEIKVYLREIVIE